MEEKITWKKVLENNINLKLLTQVLPTKGNLVYEYNPFHNYRLNKPMYEYNNLLYSKLELKDLFNICPKSEKVPKSDELSWIIFDRHSPTKYKELKPDECPVLREPGELTDFIVDDLHLSLDHPVDIIPLASYDGSVNLIINDGLNIPRLINSRFSATGKNTYEVVDRKGNNDTNIYDLGEQFDIDTSLYKRVIKIPKIRFDGVIVGGNLKVGNYHFYFKLADTDGNESDFIGESGLVSVFIGNYAPSSIHSGNRNENSYKSVSFNLSNIDSAYDYVSVYYSRYSSEDNKTPNTEYIKINKKFKINTSGICTLLISGYEPSEAITATEINLSYNIVDKANTLAICLNMLFLGNVHKPDLPYLELSDLSLRFLPYLKLDKYDLQMDHSYVISTSSKGYYDPKYIYEKTGYWGEELYRLGIVYIMPNNTLSPVFNIRGACNIGIYTKNYYSNIPVRDGNGRKYIDYNEQTFKIIEDNKEKEETKSSLGTAYYENVKGVIRFNPTLDTDTIYGIDIRTDNATITELKKYVKGFFFVRQPRIPTILALGITIGIDLNSYTPCLPTAGGLLDLLSNSLDKTHVETEDINDVNYISEGFLTRYKFTLKPKHSSLFKNILKGVGVAVGLTALAAAIVFTGGAAGLIGGAALTTASGATVGGAVAAGLGAVGSAAAAVAGVAGVGTMTAGVAAGYVGMVIGGAAVAGAVGTAAAGAALEIRYGLERSGAKKKLDGRNTKIPSGYKKVETNESRLLDLDFFARCIIKDPSKVKVLGILCPDYELNQPYYNSIFTGNDHMLGLTISLSINKLSGYKSNYFTNKDRHFYIPNYYDAGARNIYNFKIRGVPSDNKLVGIDTLKFRSQAGSAEESWRYESIGDDYKSEENKINEELEEDSETISNKKINSDIIRGNFGAYLAFNDESNRFSPAETVNIYIPGYSPSKLSEYIKLRFQDNAKYMAISDRIDILESDNYLVNPKNLIVGDSSHTEGGYTYLVYRGDCYLCLFTHRLNRNFNDPSAPYNDEIVDKSSWKDHYDPEKPDSYSEINAGDVNAIQLGMWVTFRVRSSNNLNIRTLDGSNSDEASMTGHPRGFYPYQDMSVEGIYKHPESEVFNQGFSKHLSEKWNIELPDVPYIKNWYGTRIMYSDVQVNDAFKNGYRIFLPTNYVDYTREYGSITKLISLQSNLLCVFEHGVALIPVNERAIAGAGAGGNVFINTSKVLPEAPKIISDMFGSLWADSILKVPGLTGNSPLYVYGVDTVARKIWRTDGNTLECISDFRVQEFLNNNISLSERELTPIIGIRNVKTVYNAYKRDVLFTFYDNTYGFEEKVWNLCWNELLLKFITFYSWVPSYMENINNIPFSFDRNISKWIAKLGTSHDESSIADGITLTNNIVNDHFTSIITLDGTKVDHIMVDNFKFPITYVNDKGTLSIVYATLLDEKKDQFIGVLGLRNRFLPSENIPYNIKFSLEKDPYNNYLLFTIKNLSYLSSKGGATTRLGDLVIDAKYPDMLIIKQGLYLNMGSEEYNPISINKDNNWSNVYDEQGNLVFTYIPQYYPKDLYSEFYYRNKAFKKYSDYEDNKIKWNDLNTEILAESEVIQLDLNTYKLYLKNNPQYPVFTETIHGVYSKCDFTIKDLELNIDEPLFPWNNYAVPKDLAPTSSYSLFDLPIYKDITGKRPYLNRQDLLNPLRIVTLLNVKAKIIIEQVDDLNTSMEDAYYNMKANYEPGTNLVDLGLYESVIALTPKHNMLYLTSDFWKHGLAGIIDIADKIYPTYWYGKQHPFEFECMVVNDPSVHKIFNNLEIISNKVKPESFHYEIIGDAYDFAKDKPNMYFRLEAIKALWQYNGEDITYNRNFLEIQPRLLHKSADLIHKYFARLDTINEIEDFYISATNAGGKNYNHLSGAEVVYYPNRLEYRIVNHVKAVSIDDLLDTTNHWDKTDNITNNNVDYRYSNSYSGGRSIIAANCLYLEDRWKVLINPILVCYKNEYTRKQGDYLFSEWNSTWTKSFNSNLLLPSLPINNSPIPDIVKKAGEIKFPDTSTGEGKHNALYGLYDMSKFNEQGGYKPLDTSNWASTQYSDSNRKEVDIRDKFLKLKIRYTGNELAIIDFLNTIYRISYA